MNCALDFIAIHGVALAEKERERQEREEARRRAVIARTIEWCDTEVNEALLKAAAEGNDTITVTFPVRFNEDGDEFAVLNDYISNRGRHYWCGGEWLDWDTLVSYLHSHCLEANYYWKDGYSSSNGYNYLRTACIRVFVRMPQCLG